MRFESALKGCCLLLALLCLALPAHANRLALGKEAPPLAMTTLDGQRIATEDLKGQVVLVTFWATWCSPCVSELALLSDYAKAHAAQGLRVLAISLDTPESLADVRARAGGLAFPVGLLAQASLPGYGRIWRIPVSFVIDRRGRLVDNGWQDAQPVWTAARLEQVVTPLLDNSTH